MKRLIGYWIVGFGLVFNLGCSRQVESDVTIRLAGDMSAKSSLSASENLVHIIINIRGPGINPMIQWHWDSHGPMGQVSSAPSEIEIVVPRGSDRIIQYIGVFENQTTGAMRFAYGDTRVAVAGTSQSVDIATKFIGESAYEGRVGGRFIAHNGPDRGPTGRIITSIQPPQSASTLGTTPPAMIVDQSEMFAGWFKVLVLSGATQISHRLMPQGINLFHNIALESPILNPGAGNHKVLRAHIPMAYRWDPNWNSGQVEMYSARRLIMGVFGPAASTSNLKACYNINTDYVPKLYLDGQNNPPQESLPWSPTACAEGEACVAGGGTSSCSGDAFVHRLDFREDLVGNGGQGAYGFKGPFKAIGSYGTYLESSYSSGQVHLNWQYLPGVFQGEYAIDGVSIYKTSSSSYSEEDFKDAVYCEYLTERGFIKVGERLGANQTQFSMTLDESDLSSTNFIVCPFNEGEFKPGRHYFTTVIRTHGCLAGSCHTGVDCESGSPAVGVMCQGGAIFAGSLNGFLYMVTPGNCTDSTTPTCDGSMDQLIKAWGAYGQFTGADSNADGAGNTAELVSGSYTGVDAAEYCANMSYGGYNDWFLPASNELHHLYNNKSQIGGFVPNGVYYSSTEADNYTSIRRNMSDGVTVTGDKTESHYIRCVRSWE